MDKKTYIQNLLAYLKSQKVRQSDINKVIGEYEGLYEEALENGFDDDQVSKQLGAPESIYHELGSDLRHEEDPRNKIVGVTPFFSIIIFFLIGFLARGWNYAWIAFLLIPVTAIILQVEAVHKFLALSPFIATVAYVLISFFYPPFLSYGWFLYAFILLAAAVTDPITFKKLFWAVLTIGAVAAHLLIGFNTGLWGYAWIVYAVPVLYGVFVHELEIRIEILKNWRKNPILTFLVLLVIFAYLAVSVIFNAWNWSWMILLFIPMFGIYSSQKFTMLVPYSPFVATILFFSTGYFLGWWQFSWMFFLMIPILGVLSSHGERD